MDRFPSPLEFTRLVSLTGPGIRPNKTRFDHLHTHWSFNLLRKIRFDSAGLRPGRTVGLGVRRGRFAQAGKRSLTQTGAVLWVAWILG